MRNLILLLVIFYLLYLLYPFYQRSAAACIDGQTDKGKRFVKNLETIASGLTFDDAELLATELNKPALSRKAPAILNPDQYGPNLITKA